MVCGLPQPQFFLLLIQFNLIPLNLLLLILDLAGKTRNLSSDFPQFRFIRSQRLILLVPFSFCLFQKPFQFCPASFHLSLGRVIMLDLGTGRSTVVQKLHDLLLTFFHLCRLTGNPALHLNQRFLCLLISFGYFQKLPTDIRLLPGKFLKLPLSRLNLNPDRMTAVIIMLIIHPHSIDLLFQYIDLAFQLLL